MLIAPRKHQEIPDHIMKIAANVHHRNVLKKFIFSEQNNIIAYQQKLAKRVAGVAQ